MSDVGKLEEELLVRGLSKWYEPEIPLVIIVDDQ